MSDEIKESVGKAIKDRLSNPIWGYVILSWFPINWDSLAILFMSDAPIKFRLDYITLQPYHFIKFIIAPVVVGSILAVLTPYFQLILAKSHEWADKRHVNSVNQKNDNSLMYKISSAKLTAEAEHAAQRAKDVLDEEDRLRKAKVSADVIAEEERGKQSKLDTHALEEKVESNRLLIESQEGKNKKLLSDHESLEKKIKGLKLKVADILNKIDSMADSKDEEKMKENYQELESLFSSVELAQSRSEARINDGNNYFSKLLNSASLSSLGDIKIVDAMQNESLISSGTKSLQYSYIDSASKAVADAFKERDRLMAESIKSLSPYNSYLKSQSEMLKNSSQEITSLNNMSVARPGQNKLTIQDVNAKGEKNEPNS